MLFKEVSFFHVPNEKGLYLVKDNWNDFNYKTLYTLYYYDKKKVTIGRIKIASRSEKLSTSIPSEFNSLDESYFSLGQDSGFYLNLNKLGVEMKERILIALNDIAYDLDLYENVKNLDITSTSLLREVNSFTVKDKFNRIAHNGVELTPYNFQFSFEINNNSVAKFEFEVVPKSTPPSNIHAIIGSNGVGKTTLLKNMIDSVLNPTKTGNNHFINLEYEEQDDSLFANIIFISFSAFDLNGFYEEKLNNQGESYYSYIGLSESGLEKKQDHSNEHRISKTPDQLAYEFLESIKKIIASSSSVSKFNRWKAAIEILEADNVLKSFNLTEIKSQSDDEIISLFKNLSSGHKLIILIITRLIEKVTEKSLVIIDEPESHLHPPLLSSFVSALSRILISQNGVSIIATHSPVILQELPRSCVSILRRGRTKISVSRPKIETYGENVGTLTREVFGLEVTYSGFHTLLQKLVNQGRDYDKILSMFNDSLGLEARTILRTMIAERDLNEL
ncbi:MULTISPECIES: AAA family ATPase [Bacillus cereus group]|uniref:AAA family ATPase n=1 Tax=Bacillus cereus group TaxID=86661 RepID=UPI000BF8A0FB|nr:MULTISPECIES: AAA family ATPase [Bacillus cereus group]PEZ18541.1 hypothetical protein CN337_22350 [Bacillus anthracis]PGK04929.1 hypothetical protein CN892_21605 [Bacillus anthracis]PHG45974.1 hypothetical protein COI54_16665 [Bacillus wiedmannii]